MMPMINGLQKLTLLDYPEKVACTIFFGGCNFRCPFCHNASLVVKPRNCEQIEEETVLAFLRKRQGVLDGVCITGGEPLLQPGIEDFIRKVRALGYAVKLDTNGYFPALLRHLVETGLIDYVAMDIKNSPEYYPVTTGLSVLDLSPILESVEFLKTCGIPYEFRTTVVEGLHDEERMAEIADWLEGVPRYFLQNFVDSGDLIAPGLSAVPKERMQKFLEIVKEKIPAAALRGISA